MVEAIKDRAIKALETDPEKVFMVYAGDGHQAKSFREILSMTHIKIESFNNFATAAGLASSSSGLSCLARCLSAIYDL